MTTDSRGPSDKRPVEGSEQAAGEPSPPPDPAWEAMIGWLDCDPIDDIDEFLYG